jgi:4-hydroxy-3-methylbut-2-en-1-yl diphosphate reductase
MPTTPDKLLLAAPRGYCAGVDRAVQTVERALELYGAPVYVRKEIVHNKHVVEQLRERGAVFVESETEVPEGATVVFSAHGVAPSVHANASERKLHTIDATCPLVTKVHVEAKKFATEDYTIVLVGHAGHEEVEGTMGEAPEHIVLIENEDDVDALEVRDPDKVAYISQTTLSVDETRAIINRLRERFPKITGPRTEDICYATTNRQAAVKQLARECGRTRARRRLVSDRQRVAGRRGVARGQAGRRHHLGRERARRARPAPGGVLPRSRDDRRAGARGRQGGRPLHAPEGDPPGNGGPFVVVGHSP